MYFGSKKKKLNQFCIEEKKEEVSLSGMSNVLSAIVDSMRLQIKRIEKKKETAYNNYQLISNCERQIKSKESRVFKKKEEITILQEKVKQKKKRKREIVSIIESYISLLKDNDLLLNEQLEVIRKREREISKKEEALEKVYMINKGQKENGGYPLKERGNSNLKKKIPCKNKSVDFLNKLEKRECIKKNSSVPALNLNKEQFDILNKRLLNEDDFNKVLDSFKNRVESKPNTHRNSIGSASKREQVKTLTDSKYNLSNGNTLHNSKDIETSFQSQTKTPFKLNIHQRNKHLNSSKEKLKKFLLNESNEKQFNLTMDNREQYINSSNSNNNSIIKKINKSKSDAIIKKKQPNLIFSSKRSSFVDFDNDTSFIQTRTEMKRYKTFSIKLYQILIFSIRKRHISSLINHTLLSHIMLSYLIIHHKIVNKKIAKNIKNVIVKVSTLYNEKVKYNQIELVNVEDFFDESLSSRTVTENGDTIENYTESLTKIKKITKETKQLENNMRQFASKVCDIDY